MNRNINPIWADILNRFPDQSNGEISPEDIRAFVNAVQKTKEDQHHYEEKLQDIWSNPYIYEDDLIIINNQNQLDPDYQYNGIYIAKISHPQNLNHLWLVTKGIQKADDIPDEYKPISNATQDALDLKYDKTGGNIDGDIKVKNRLTIHYDENTHKAYFILKDGSGNNINFLVVDNDGTLTGHNTLPNNDYDLANKKYVDNLYQQGLGVKEDYLGLPTNNFQFLSSDVNGVRQWKSPSLPWGMLVGDINNQGDLQAILATKWDGKYTLDITENIGLTGLSKNILRFETNIDQNSQPYPYVKFGDIGSDIGIFGTLIRDINLSINTGLASDGKILIRRLDDSSNQGNPSSYNKEILVGDEGVKTALLGDVGYDPVIRKGALNHTIDYKIYSTEDFDIGDFATAVHQHNISDIIDLQDSLDDKADLVHIHQVSDVTDLQDELNAKADLNHQHHIADIDQLQATLNTKSDTGHIHTIDNIVDLQDTLDTKWDGTEDITIGENILIKDINGNPIINYHITGNAPGDFFDNKTYLYVGFDDCITNIRGTINDPIVLKNNTAIQAWDSTYSKKVNLISRDDHTISGLPLDDVILGDGNVRTAIRAGDNTLDPVVRKGAYGSTTDYMIYTTEFFDYTLLADRNHTHTIGDIEDLFDNLDHKLDDNGDQFLDGRLQVNQILLPAEGNTLLIDNIQNGQNFRMVNNNIGSDNIFDITKQDVNEYDFTMFGNIISTLDCTEDKHLTHKKYVDDALLLKLNLTGGTVTGQIKGISPVDNEDLSTKLYVDTQINTHIHDTRYLQLTGGTINGDLTIDGDNDITGKLSVTQDTKIEGVLEVTGHTRLKNNTVIYPAPDSGDYATLSFYDSDPANINNYPNIVWSHNDKRFEIVNANDNPADPAHMIYHEGNLPVALAVTDIPDPATATTEDVANKINELLASLRAAGYLAS